MNLTSKQRKLLRSKAHHLKPYIIIGKNGVEKIEVVDLDEKEKSEFIHSVESVKNLWEAAFKIDPDLNK